jgi:FkbM family methyltransferase
MNFGATTLYFAAKPNFEHIYSFEPFLPTYEEAIRNFELNEGLKQKIRTFPIGLGSKNEKRQVLYDKRAAGGMSTTINRFDKSDAIYQAENAVLEDVEIRNASEALSPLVEQHKNRKIVLKVDTEGAEYDILRAPDEGSVLKIIDVIMLEYHFKSPQELEDRLTTNGFVVFYRGKHNKGEKVGMIHAVRNN